MYMYIYAYLCTYNTVLLCNWVLRVEGEIGWGGGGGGVAYIYFTSSRGESGG